MGLHTSLRRKSWDMSGGCQAEGGLKQSARYKKLMDHIFVVASRQVVK